MPTATLPELAGDELDAILRRLSTFPAVLPLTVVPDALEMPRDAAAEALGSLAALGMVEAWESPRGPSVTLSSLAAERLGLELVADSEANPATGSGTTVMRWVARGRAKNERAHLLLVEDFDGFRSADGLGDALDTFPDPRPMAPAESFVIHLIRQPGWRLWGFSLPGWSPALESSNPCAVCQGREFTRIDLCMACMRSGRDYELEKVEKPRPKPKPVPAVESDGLTGGVGKAAPRKRPVKKTAGTPSKKKAPAVWMAELSEMRRRVGR